MTNGESARVRANRANAQRSTGPRTEAGKARVAQNARRHGLSVPRSLPGAWSAEATRLARLLMPDASDGCRAALCNLIDAQLEINRVRVVRNSVSAELIALPVEDARPQSDARARLFGELDRLQRYERRAFLALTRAVLSLEGDSPELPADFY